MVQVQGRQTDAFSWSVKAQALSFSIAELPYCHCPAARHH